MAPTWVSMYSKALTTSGEPESKLSPIDFKYRTIDK